MQYSKMTASDVQDGFNKQEMLVQFFKLCRPDSFLINPLAPELFFKFLHTLYLKCE
jgi:hypothetical protein